MRSALIPPLVALACVATVALAQSPKTQDPAGDDAAIESLTAEVAALRLEVERLTAESKDVTERTALLEHGFRSVGQGATDLSKVLDRSEELGFTAGINYESRVALLDGWRKYLTALAAAAPRPKRETAARPR